MESRIFQKQRIVYNGLNKLHSCCGRRRDQLRSCVSNSLYKSANQFGCGLCQLRDRLNNPFGQRGDNRNSPLGQLRRCVGNPTKDIENNIRSKFQQLGQPFCGVSNQCINSFGKFLF